MGGCCPEAMHCASIRPPPGTPARPAVRDGDRAARCAKPKDMLIDRSSCRPGPTSGVRARDDCRSDLSSRACVLGYMNLK
jgi:hypothetical protein